MAGWDDTSFPKAITANDVQRVLDSCDISDPANDLDWRAGRIILRGKASREDRMPLPADVAEAATTALLGRSANTPQAGETLHEIGGGRNAGGGFGHPGCGLAGSGDVLRREDGA